jgi:glutathione S-transferase
MVILTGSGRRTGLHEVIKPAKENIMLTLFHAPKSRSSRVRSLIDEMGIQDWVQIVPVNIMRQDGSGARDTANPHPEGKAPCLLHDGTLITESGAVMLYLTTLFPDTGLAPKPGDAQWGEYLTWMVWYGSVMEPVMIHEAMGIAHPALTATFRSSVEITARLRAVLEKGPYLLGDAFSAADMLVHSPYAWFKDRTPNDDLIRDWVARCSGRASVARTLAADMALMDQAVAA